jgi:hypothetical protein
VADLVEGETLAYQITVGERFRILILSTANFVERELEGHGRTWRSWPRSAARSTTTSAV